MTLRHMKIFVAVCESGSATIAAEKLYIAQPSVSLAIRELEEHYETRLFDRISRRLYLTDTGRRLLAYATHIVSLFDEAEQEMHNRDSVGSLRLGSSITIGTCLLPGYVQRFQELHPGIEVYVAMDNSRQIIRQVRENALDFALVEGVPEDPQLLYERFQDDQLVLVCPNASSLAKRGKVSPKELSGCDFLLREKGSGARELFDSSMLLHNLVVEPHWECISTQAILNAVAAGLGVSVLPLRLARPALEQGLVSRVSIDGVNLERHFYIVYHHNKYLSEPMRAFMELCRRQEDA